MHDVMRIAKEFHSPVCLRFSNSDYQRVSTCEKCLPKVHFKRKNNGNIRDYDCQNMIYYNISVFKYYFLYKDDPSLKFGAAHSDFRVDFSNIPEDLINYFEMWDEYRSAQLVLIKN
jgi:hypothetical protein